MTVPERLAFDPSSEFAGVLLRAARRRAPEGARRRAVVAATAAAAATSLAAGAAAAGAGVVKGGSLGSLAWIGVAGMLGVGSMAAAVAIHGYEVSPSVRADDPASPQATALPTSRAVPRPATTAVAQPPPAPAASVTAVEPEPSHPSTLAVAPAPASSPSATASPMTLELAMLDQARAALANGNPAGALSILDAYAARFPHASMAPEASMLRIEALVRAGDTAAARRVADAFLAHNPQSPYASRIGSLLGDSP
jgi:hypothetical protein